MNCTGNFIHHLYEKIWLWSDVNCYDNNKIRLKEKRFIFFKAFGIHTEWKIVIDKKNTHPQIEAIGPKTMKISFKFEACKLGREYCIYGTLIFLFV